MIYFIEEYLDLMCSKIRDKEARKKARLEIENHLLDQINAYQIRHSVDLGEATKQVMAEATPPCELGKKLNMAHQPFWLRFPIMMTLTSGSIVALITLVFLSHYLVDKVFIPEIQKSMNKDILEVHAKFKNDLDIIKKYKWHSYQRWSNAHNYIKSRLPKEDYPIPIPSRYKYKKWKTDPETLKHIATFDELYDIELAWFDKILDYDHWNFHATADIKVKVDELKNSGSIKKIGFVSAITFPNMSQFRDLLMIYTLQLIKKKQHQKAEKIFDHATQLLISSNTLIGWASAASNMKIKNVWIGTFKLQGWKSIPDELVLAYKRVGWGWAGVFARHTQSSGDLEKWSEYLRPELGMCVGVLEYPLGKTYMADFLYPKAFFESDFQSDMRSSVWRDKLRLEKCDADELGQLLTLNSSGLDPFDGDIWNIFFMESDLMKWVADYIPINLAKIPYLRRIIGFYLNTLAFPNYYDIYTRDT